MINNRYKMLVVIGPTASGKSDLALSLAEQFNGEIVCADSRTVYRGMDIGTAKPSPVDQARVPHWGLDLVDPNQLFTAADFKDYAMRVTADIAGRGNLPILVGGSGLYIDGVLYDYDFRAPADPQVRAELEGLSVAVLQARVMGLGLPLPVNEQNPRHLMRIIEAGKQGGVANRERGVRPNTLVLGTAIDMTDLEQRIVTRLEQMLDQGLVDEVGNLADKYGWQVQAMQSPGYREFRDYFEGRTSLDEAKQQVYRNTRAFAKRQVTWFKRNKSIQWLSTEDKYATAVDLTTTFLKT